MHSYLEACSPLCMLGNLIVVKYFFTFLNNCFRNTSVKLYSFDPDQAKHFGGPVLGIKCLQRLSADNTSRHLRVKS